MAPLTSPADIWTRGRQTFADQFEPYGSGFTYRKSQKGEALSVSGEERAHFIANFDRDLRRSTWLLWISVTVALGAVFLFSLLKGFELPESGIIGGFVVGTVPYVAYFRWAWAAPARELAGRTPVAGERSSEEVRRLQLQRITYGQLGIAALGGLALPFVGASKGESFAGWNRLWLVFGCSLVLLAAVQAFRKWRLDQEDSLKNTIPAAPKQDIRRAPGAIRFPGQGQLGRYVPAAIVLIVLALIAFTAAGKQLAKLPSFWSILMIGFGGWSLFTVWRGLAKGEIQPFARGFYNTYQRETQPKRFWASMAWNCILGCLCIGLAFLTSFHEAANGTADRCYDQQRAFSPQQEIAACDKLLATSNQTNRGYVLGARAFACERMNDHEGALADYSDSIRLNPREPDDRFNRGLIYQQRGETQRAIADFTAAITLQPDSAEAYLQRGSAYEHIGKLRQAIADFDAVVRLKPHDADGYYYRGEAYANLGDDERAKADYVTATHLNPTLRNPYE